MITLLFIERDWARPHDQKVWFVNSLESIGFHGNDTKSKYFVCSKDFLSRKIFTFEIDFWTFSSHQKMLVFNWSTADESFSSSLARIFSFSKIKKIRIYRVRDHKSKKSFREIKWRNEYEFDGFSSARTLILAFLTNSDDDATGKF